MTASPKPDVAEIGESWRNLKWQVRRAVAMTLLEWAQRAAVRAGPGFHIALMNAATALHNAEKPVAITKETDNGPL